MNQQLTDFLNQAKATGQTDEQIKNSLRAAGWQESDIRQAFPTTSPSTPALASSPIVSGGSWLSGKIIVAIIIAILIMGAGVYFAFIKPAPKNSLVNHNPGNNLIAGNQTNGAGQQNQPATGQSNLVSDSSRNYIPAPAKPILPFYCKDLFTDSDFQRITGIDPKTLTMIDTSTEPDNSVGNFAESGKTILERGFFMCNWLGAPGKSFLRFQVMLMDDFHIKILDQMRQSALARPGTFSVVNIGSYSLVPAIYATSYDMITLTDNKKYRIDVILDKNISSVNIVDIAKAVAKIVNDNLNKY